MTTREYDSNIPESGTTRERDIVDSSAGIADPAGTEFSVPFVDMMKKARKRRRWGRKFKPPVDPQEGRSHLRGICDEILELASGIDDLTIDNRIPEECSGAIAEILISIEQLYDCPYGEGESLKAVAVALKSQLSNAEWSISHLQFLIEVTKMIKARYLIDEQTAAAVFEMVDEFDLDVFRGTVSDTNIVTKYKIVADE